VNALYLQQARHFSAFETGLCTLPVAIMALFCGPISGRLVAKFGTRPSLLIAGAGIVVSTLLLTQLSEDLAVVLLLAVYVVFGIGFGMVNPAISTVAVAGMPRAQAGVAAAVASTSRQVGAVLGIAIVGTIVNTNGQMHDFARATHPIWWLMAACGGVIFVLGWATNTRWAQSTARRNAA
jgi:MFS family permease